MGRNLAHRGPDRPLGGVQAAAWSLEGPCAESNPLGTLPNSGHVAIRPRTRARTSASLCPGPQRRGSHRAPSLAWSRSLCQGPFPGLSHGDVGFMSIQLHLAAQQTAAALYLVLWHGVPEPRVS